MNQLHLGSPVDFSPEALLETDLWALAARFKGRQADSGGG
jgi:hypothetical protein